MTVDVWMLLLLEQGDSAVSYATQRLWAMTSSWNGWLNILRRMANIWVVQSMEMNEIRTFKVFGAGNKYFSAVLNRSYDHVSVETDTLLRVFLHNSKQGFLVETWWWIYMIFKPSFFSSYSNLDLIYFYFFFNGKLNFIEKTNKKLWDYTLDLPTLVLSCIYFARIDWVHIVKYLNIIFE